MADNYEVAADLDPKTRWGRKIYVSRYREFTKVELNRDTWVDTHRSGANLSETFEAAIENYRDAAMTRLWVDGYAGGFGWGGGPRFIELSVPHQYVSAAVTSLRKAELNDDVTGLNRLADKLRPPIDDWLAPGERSLTLGRDFACSPSQMLKFLRGEARRRGLRVNGRVDWPTVWVQPTRDPLQARIRKVDVEQPDPYPLSAEPVKRPLAARRPRTGSSRQEPVRFIRRETIADPDECPCGWEESENHDRQHMRWSEGIPLPQTIHAMADVVVVPDTSPKSWRKVAYEMARIAQRDGRYDFSSFNHLDDDPSPAGDDPRAYMFAVRRRAVGFLSVHDTEQHGRVEFISGQSITYDNHQTRPRVILIFVADRWRRRGVGRSLIEAAAADSGITTADISWSLPFSKAGRALAQSMHPEGVWVS